MKTLKIIFTLLIGFSLILIPQNLTASMVDDFDAYDDGDLDTQGGWVKLGNVFTVGAAYKYEASGKGVMGENSVGEDIFSNTFTADATGNQIAYLSGRESGSICSMIMSEGSQGTRRIWWGVRIGDSKIKYHDGGGWVDIGAASEDVWYKTEAEWRTSDDNAQYRAGQATYGDNWTPTSPAWTTWDTTYTAFTTIDIIEMYPDEGTLGNDCWFDEFSDPNVVAAVAPKKKLELD